MNLVTVFKASSQAEAELTRARLEAAGFEAVVVGEPAALNMELISAATGGIRVEVMEDQAAEARAFLDTGDVPAGNESAE